MGYQLKISVLETPKKELSPAERKALELAIDDVGTFLEASLQANTPKKTGKTASSIRKLVFKNQLSAKAFYDESVAPWVFELMRGNKAPRIIAARNVSVLGGRANALKFVARDGTILFRQSVKRPRTFGLRIPEKLRQSTTTTDRVRQILLARLSNELTGETLTIDLSPVMINK